MSSVAPNITGMRSGRLVAIRQDHQNKYGLWVWLCQCDCGATTTAPPSSIRNGNYILDWTRQNQAKKKPAAAGFIRLPSHSQGMSL